MNNRHRSTGTAGPELFTKNAVLTWSNRRMVEATGINCDQIPTMQGIESACRTSERRDIRTGMEERTKRLIKSFIQDRGKTQNGHHQTRKHDQDLFHTFLSKAVFT